LSVAPASRCGAATRSVTDSDMHAGRFDLRCDDPLGRNAVAAESRTVVPSEKHGIAERREGRFIEANEIAELGCAKSDMVEHDRFLS
jgi:hypothetical protein